MTFLAAAPILPVPGSGRVDWVLIVASIAIVAIGIAAFLVWSNRSEPQATAISGPARKAIKPPIDNQRKAA